MRVRIYLVEDSPIIRDNLAESLEELAGARVVGWASTEKEAIEWLTQKNASWDLAVIDLFLLQGSGLNVVTRCKDRNFRQKLVVLTNYATPAIRERCLALGADAIFDKSNELDEFFAYCIAETTQVTP